MAVVSITKITFSELFQALGVCLTKAQYDYKDFCCGQFGLLIDCVNLLTVLVLSLPGRVGQLCSQWRNPWIAERRRGPWKTLAPICSPPAFVLLWALCSVLLVNFPQWVERVLDNPVILGPMAPILSDALLICARLGPTLVYSILSAAAVLLFYVATQELLSIPDGSA